MASEQFSLCWDNFHKNMSSGMNSLLENEDLVDVTLAVEGKYLKAHKMVLSVCSPYFKELFKTNPCKHPIVFMKDVSYVALSDLIQFMYQGEVQVSQENLTTFIKTAEALQIKGLTGDGNGSAENDVEQDDKPIEIADDFKPAAMQVPRPKKIPQPMPPIAAPAPKRQRVSAPPIPEPPAPMPKVEPPSVSTPAPEVVHFKMEPYDQSQNASMQEETGDDNFGDDTLDDTAVDDTEDYSMMEGNEEEPQAGTSTEETGEGQDIIFFDVGTKNPKIIVDDHDFNMARKTPTKTMWVCSSYFRTKCRCRITTCGRFVYISGDHNHLPKQHKSKFTNMLSQLVTIVRVMK